MFDALRGHFMDVPVGATHRRANDGVETLLITEVQRRYTGGHGIVRHEDDYEPRADLAGSAPSVVDAVVHGSTPDA